MRAWLSSNLKKLVAFIIANKRLPGLRLADACFVRCKRRCAICLIYQLTLPSSYISTSEAEKGAGKR